MKNEKTAKPTKTIKKKSVKRSNTVPKIFMVFNRKDLLIYKITSDFIENSDRLQDFIDGRGKKAAEGVLRMRRLLQVLAMIDFEDFEGLKKDENGFVKLTMFKLAKLTGKSYSAIFSLVKETAEFEMDLEIIEQKNKGEIRVITDVLHDYDENQDLTRCLRPEKHDMNISQLIPFSMYVEHFWKGHFMAMNSIPFRAGDFVSREWVEREWDFLFLNHNEERFAFFVRMYLGADMCNPLEGKGEITHEKQRKWFNDLNFSSSMRTAYIRGDRMLRDKAQENLSKKDNEIIEKHKERLGKEKEDLFWEEYPQEGWNRIVANCKIPEKFGIPGTPGLADYEDLPIEVSTNGIDLSLKIADGERDLFSKFYWRKKKDGVENPSLNEYMLSRERKIWEQIVKDKELAGKDGVLKLQIDNTLVTVDLKIHGLEEFEQDFSFAFDEMMNWDEYKTIHAKEPGLIASTFEQDSYFWDGVRENLEYGDSIEDQIKEEIDGLMAGIINSERQ